MPQYASICLNNAEYDDMMVYADISEKAVQNSECVWCGTWHKVTVQITGQLSRHTYSEHCQKFKMRVLQKGRQVEVYGPRTHR